MLKCRKMSSSDTESAHHLLTKFLNEDEHYRDSSAAYGHEGDAALQNSLQLFVHRPELGFVWLAHDNEELAGVCVISYAISTSIGGIIAKLDDVMVKPEKRNCGFGSEMITLLKDQLLLEGVLRIDTSVHNRNSSGRHFYDRLNFRSLNEERLACVLTR